MQTKTKDNIIFYGLIVAFATTGLVQGIILTNMILPDKVQATGGAGDIKGLIDPIIDRAITALQSNNTDLALEEIQTLKDELDDTFSADEEEEEDDGDSDNKKKKK